MKDLSSQFDSQTLLDLNQTFFRLFTESGFLCIKVSQSRKKDILNNFHSTHRSNNVTNDKNVKLSPVNFLRLPRSVWTNPHREIASQQQRSLSLGADHLTLEGGGGVGDFEKKFPASACWKKKIACSTNDIEKKILALLQARKKIVASYFIGALQNPCN